MHLIKVRIDRLSFGSIQSRRITLYSFLPLLVSCIMIGYSLLALAKRMPRSGQRLSYQEYWFRTCHSRAETDFGFEQIASLVKKQEQWSNKARSIFFASPRRLVNRLLVAIDRWFPSSRRCSGCGFVMDLMPLSVRSWVCPQCKAEHDRDVNAALNIKAAGLAVLALGANVSGRGQVPVSCSQ